MCLSKHEIHNCFYFLCWHVVTWLLYQMWVNFALGNGLVRNMCSGIPLTFNNNLSISGEMISHVFRVRYAHFCRSVNHSCYHISTLGIAWIMITSKLLYMRTHAHSCPLIHTITSTGLIFSREMPQSAGAPDAASRRGWFVLTISGAPGDDGATSRGAPFRAEMGTFLFWAVHWGMSEGCIVGFVLVYCCYCLTDLSKLFCGTYNIDICMMIWHLLLYYVQTNSQYHIEYIPRNMHTVLLCFALLWLCNRS